VSDDASGFIAEQDGPELVAFARLDPVTNTKYLEQYIDIHGANRYRYYRNRSLWALLRPVLTYPDASWVRAILEKLITSALTTTPIDFEGFLPLSVRALLARRGDKLAATSLENYRKSVFEESKQLEDTRGKSDSWSHYHRRACALAEVYATALDGSDVAAASLSLAFELPKGFAGFRTFSALTLAESVEITQPRERHRIEAALESARAAAHRIQDYRFCMQATAMVNALRSRWWTPSKMEIEPVIERFLKEPQAEEFSTVHCIGERYIHRAHDSHSLPIPYEVLNAQTLREVATIYRRTREELATLNPLLAGGIDQQLTEVDEISIPDPDFIPILAARFAGALLAATDVHPERRRMLIQQLVGLAAPNATALDTILGRLMLATASTVFEMPNVLVALELPEQAPQAKFVEGAGASTR
jgi:hypothetical protein